jgi:hypothetical protein
MSLRVGVLIFSVIKILARMFLLNMVGDLAVDFLDGAGEIVREPRSVHRRRFGGDEAVTFLGEVVTTKLVVHGDDGLNLKGEPRRESRDAVAHIHHCPSEFIPSGTLLLKLGFKKGDCVVLIFHK